MKRYKDDPDLERVLEKLGPYYRFSVQASFRSLENGTITEYTDMEEMMEQLQTTFICIDTALNMFTRVKGKLRERINSPGVLRISLVQQPEEPIDGADPTRWFDLMLDEFPINCKGMVDENGKDFTFYKSEKSLSS